MKFFNFLPHKKFILIGVLIILLGIFVYKAIFLGWNCGVSCSPYGFCRCHGISLGDSKCLGVKTYLEECCIECQRLP